METMVVIWVFEKVRLLGNRAKINPGLMDKHMLCYLLIGKNQRNLKWLGWGFVIFVSDVESLVSEGFGISGSDWWGAIESLCGICRLHSHHLCYVH